MIDITPKYKIIPISLSVFLEDDGLGTRVGGVGTLGGKLASEVNDAAVKAENAINDDYDIITDLINARLDTSAKKILGDFTFGASGAIKMITDADNGLWFSPTGILAKKAGANTLTVTNEGDITLVGTITAVAGSIGGWDLSANAIYFDGATDVLSAGMAPADYPFYAGKKYVDRASAPFRVTPAGALVATGATISGAITITGGSGIGNLSDAGSLAVLNEVGASDCDTTIIDGGKIITGLLTASNIVTGTLNASVVTVSNLDADNITTGTLTGRTVQTASSGLRVVMGGGDTVIKFYGDSSNQGTIGFDGNNLYLLNLFASSNLYFAVGNSSSIVLGTNDSNGSILLGVGGSQKIGISSTGVEIGNGTLAMNSNKITGLATPTSDYDASTKKYVDDNVYTDSDARGAINNVIGSDGHLDATLDCDGYDITDVDLLTVDEITMLAAPYKIAGSYTSIEFETSASSNGGVTLTGGSNGTTVNGPLLLNDLLKLDSRSSTPGAAASYTGYIYYDTTQTTLVFSNGSGWYKVTATTI